MKPFGTHAFVNQLVAGLLVTIGFGGTVGLGTVWVRHQLSVMADTNRQLDQQYHDVERHIADMQALVEEARDPNLLRRENDTLHLGLVAMTQAQVVDVTTDPMRQLVLDSNRHELESGDTARGGVRVQFVVPAPAAAAVTPTSGDRSSAPVAPAAAGARGAVSAIRGPAIQFAFNR